MTVTGRGRWSQRLGAWLLGAIGFIALAAPTIAPHAHSDQFDDRAFAPPSRIRVIGPNGLTAPFIHPLVLENRLHRQFREDRSIVIPLRWFDRGRLVSTDATAEPLLLLGADPIGRDVFSRLVLGARLSLGVTLFGVIGALTIGGMIGGLAGTIGGRADRALMLAADFLLAVPGAYLVLVLRRTLAPVLETSEVFVLIAALFAVAAWPHTARGVRAIVMSERRRDYAEAARAAGAGPWRLARHLLPAATGFLAVEVVLLLPALLVAEATISYLGLGFVAEPSWGTMIQDAADHRILADAPWLLAPAAGIFIVALAAQLLGTSRGQALAWLQAPRSS